jgi:hypothetical protein
LSDELGLWKWNDWGIGYGRFWAGVFGLVIGILTHVDFVARTFDLRWVGIFGMAALGVLEVLDMGL